MCLPFWTKWIKFTFKSPFLKPHPYPVLPLLYSNMSRSRPRPYRVLVHTKLDSLNRVRNLEPQVFNFYLSTEFTVQSSTLREDSYDDLLKPPSLPIPVDSQNLLTELTHESREDPLPSPERQTGGRGRRRGVPDETDRWSGERRKDCFSFCTFIYLFR